MLAGVAGSPQEGEVINLTRLLDWDLPEDDGSVNMQNFIFDVADIQGIKSPPPGSDIRLSPTQNKLGHALRGEQPFKFSPEARMIQTGRFVTGLEVYGKGIVQTEQESIRLESKRGEKSEGSSRKRRKPGDPQAFSPLMDHMRMNMSIDSNFNESTHGNTSKSRVSLSPTGGFFMVPSPTNSTGRKSGASRFSVESTESIESINNVPVFEEDILNGMGMVSDWFPTAQ